MNQTKINGKRKFFLVNFIIIFMLFGAFEVLAQVNCNPDGILQPGEYCDPGELEITGDEVFFNGINSCESIPLPPEEWSGILRCNDECQLDTSGCYAVEFNPDEGITCSVCSECDGSDCNANICINFCAGGYGSCHYIGNSIVRRDCQDCLSVQKCEDYETFESCGSNGRDACNLVAKQEWDGYLCEWVKGECRTDTSCRWDCAGLYEERCDTDGFKDKVGECRFAGDLGDKELCEIRNPTNNFPNSIACALYESDFPVFNWLNIFLSIILLIGYYLVIDLFKIKKST